MRTVDCALITDGPSDAALAPVIEWTLGQHLTGAVAQVEWVDLRQLPVRPSTLADRILKTAELLDCEVLFVHRDAENQAPDQRYEEIAQAVELAGASGFDLPYVCVVPIRMQEAWLLLDERAIRCAAGNPNGKMQLALPPPDRLERVPDPKDVLAEVLRNASGLRGRRLKKFRIPNACKLITGNMVDFDCLRVLGAFQRLESDIVALAEELQIDPDQ